MKVRKLLGHVFPRWRVPLTCEACDREFICRAAISGCWCTEVKLSGAVRATLRTRYQRCLCRACLERFAADEAKEEAL